MSPEPSEALATTERAVALWNEIAAAYDAIECKLGSGSWEGFDEIATHVAGLERELQPVLATIAARRAACPAPPAELAARWHELDLMVEALARRQQQLARAAVSARDTTAARLVRARIARARVAGYTPLNPLAPQLTSRRV